MANRLMAARLSPVWLVMLKVSYDARFGDVHGGKQRVAGLSGFVSTTENNVAKECVKLRLCERMMASVLLPID